MRQLTATVDDSTVVWLRGEGVEEDIVGETLQLVVAAKEGR